MVLAFTHQAGRKKVSIMCSIVVEPSLQVVCFLHFVLHIKYKNLCIVILQVVVNI